MSACLGLVTLCALYNLHAPVRLDFDDDHAQPLSLVSGIERSSTVDGQRGAWLTTRAILNLRGLDRRVPWRVRFTARAPGGTARRVTIWADAAPLGVHRVADAFVDVEQVIPADPGASRLVLVIYAEPDVAGGKGDDLFLARLVAEPSGFALPPPNALLLNAVVSVMAGLGLAWLGLPSLVALAAVVVLSGATALAVVHGIAAYAAFPSILVAVDLASIAVLCAFRWLESRGWSVLAAGVLTAVALHVQLLVLLHPNVTYGDTAFHVHRFQEVAAGQLYFLSSGPGGQFPYPPALYVVVRFVQHVVPLGTADALRVVVALAVAMAGLIMYLAAASAWGPRPAIAGLAIYYVLPISLSIQVYAFLTNAFGNVLAAAALALAGWQAPRGRGTWWAVTASLLFALATMLAHVSSAVILAGALGTTALVCLVAGDRRGAAVAGGVLLASAALAWILYYSHFTPTYREYMSAGHRSTLAAPSAEPRQPPAMRDEAHQTRWVPGWRARMVRAAAVPRYLRRYYGLAGVLLVLAGTVVLWRRRISRFDRVVLATLLASAIFLVIGVTTPVDLRYYAAAYPFLAFAGGLAVTARLRWGGSALPVGLFVVAIVTAAIDWYGWLQTPDF
jgi:hypothetical protein